MRILFVRRLCGLVWLVLLLAGAGRASAADWSHSRKKSAKHHKRKHHTVRPTPSAAAKATGSKAAPAEEGDEEGGDESSEDESADEKAKPSKGGKTKKKVNVEQTEGEGGETKDEGEEGGDTNVVRRRATHVAAEGAGAPVAFELEAGPRVVHRNFDFNDPLANYNASVMRPYSYNLPAGPAPFVEVGLYPGAFAGRGIASRIGLVGRYEKLIGTKTEVAQGPMLSTVGQEFEVGARGRWPLGQDEVGLTATYGQHSFHVSQTDPGPTTNAIVPNVDYTFVRVGLDGRLALGPVSLGAHAGTRFVTDTGPLGKTWFPSTKTTTVEAGVSGTYQLTPLLGVVAGVDFLRYAFNFNPVPTTNAVVAGGAVDQYISGYLALRVSITGG